MKKNLLIALALLPVVAFSQVDPAGGAQTKAPTTVSISAKGADVRGVIHDLFTKAKKNYVLQPGVSFALFLSLEDVEFEEALNIVCSQAKLQFEVQNGIYYVTKLKPVVAAATPPAPKGMLPKTVLDHKITTKLTKTDIRAVFGEFAKQAGIAIEVDSNVPAYKLDAFLTKTSLKYALDKVTEATGLRYKFTDNLSIQISKAEDPNKVNISGG